MLPTCGDQPATPRICCAVQQTKFRLSISLSQYECWPFMVGQRRRRAKIPKSWISKNLMLGGPAGPQTLLDFRGGGPPPPRPPGFVGLRRPWEPMGPKDPNN